MSSFSPNAWRQIRAITIQKLGDALRRDGWEMAQGKGARQTWQKRDDHNVLMQVTLHVHPKKTMGANLLKSLLSEIGWTETDLRRLALIK